MAAANCSLLLVSGCGAICLFRVLSCHHVSLAVMDGLDDTVWVSASSASMASLSCSGASGCLWSPVYFFGKSVRLAEIAKRLQGVPHLRGLALVRGAFAAVAFPRAVPRAARRST